MSSFPGALRPGFRVVFPFAVRWDMWERAVRPVVEDPQYHPSNPSMLVLLQGTNFLSYIAILEEALKQKLIAAGFLPEGTSAPEPLPIDNPEAGIGEPVSRVEPLIPKYAQFDC